MKGKSAHDGPISGSVSTTVTRNNVRAYVDNRGAKLEGKYSDKATGMSTVMQTFCELDLLLKSQHPSYTCSGAASLDNFEQLLGCQTCILYIFDLPSPQIVADTDASTRSQPDTNMDDRQLPRYQARTRRQSHERPQSRDPDQLPPREEDLRRQAKFALQAT